MKKLMIAAAIVCAAFVSQAATLKWSASALYTYDGKNDPVNTMGTSTIAAYLFTASSASALDDLIGDVTGYLASGNFADFKDAASEVMLNKTTAKKIELDDTGANVAAGLTYGQIIFFNSDAVDTATQYYVSNQGSGSVNAELGGSIEFGSQKNEGMNSASNWTAMAVPEPTSGLLLLLGMAGLALRRRRA